MDCTVKGVEQLFWTKMGKIVRAGGPTLLSMQSHIIQVPIVHYSKLILNRKKRPFGGEEKKTMYAMIQVFFHRCSTFL